jgi:hypothetical protein
VVLAIGLMAVALLPMVALLAVGRQSASDSTNETLSVYLAQKIYSDARTSLEDGQVRFTTTLPEALRLDHALAPDRTLTDPQAAPQFTARSLTDLRDQPLHILYTQNGDPLRVVSAEEFSAGVQEEGGYFLAKISGEPDPDTDLVRVSLEVHAPAPAPEENRDVYPFATKFRSS